MLVSCPLVLDTRFCVPIANRFQISNFNFSFRTKGRIFYRTPTLIRQTMRTIHSLSREIKVNKSKFEISLWDNIHFSQLLFMLRVITTRSCIFGFFLPTYIWVLFSTHLDKFIIHFHSCYGDYLLPALAFFFKN